LELELPATARQGILGRLDIDSWRSSSKIEGLVEELSNLRNQDSTTKSIVFSQFVNFLDLIAFRLQRAGFSVNQFLHRFERQLMAGFRFAGLKVR
jgi:DNA repair protein RAD16